LFLAIKAAVDRDRQAGRFVLTGSADVMHLPAAADALVGRMIVHTLWPFSQGELDNHREEFVDTVFGDSLPGRVPETISIVDLAERVSNGGWIVPR
jgi:hypothetical protein